MANVLFVIAPRNFRDEELFDTKRELERAHHACTIASEEPGICTGSRGRKANASVALEYVDTTPYDAVVFVGGPGATVFFDDPAALHVARAMNDAGKVVAAICIAPTILAKAGLLHGRNVTAFPSETDAVTAGGARFTGKGVVVDTNIVTASGPDEATAFGKALAKVLEERGARAAE